MRQYDMMTQTRAYERDVDVCDELCDEDYDSSYDEELKPFSQVAAMRIPPQPILEPDEDFYRSITMAELKRRVFEDIDKFYDKLEADKCK